MRKILAAAAVAVTVGACAAAEEPAISDAHPKPRANFTFSPKAPFVGQQIVLRHSGRSCRQCRYRWDLRRTGRSKKRWAKIGAGRSVKRTFRSPGRHKIRLTVIAANGRKYRRERRVEVARKSTSSTAPAAQSTAGNPILGQPVCEPGATAVTTAAGLRSTLARGQDACVTAAVGNVELEDFKSATMRYAGTSPSGSIGHIRLDGASNITFRARFESTKITLSDNITIERSIIGGTPDNRTFEQLIFIPERSDDVTIRDNDIGWTAADDSGNTGYGIRAYNESARLRIERNYIHHIGGDAIQLGMSGPDTLVDRNEIAFVAKPPGSSEHADDLQVTGNGPNMRITNNYMHDNGRLQAGARANSGSGPYIHAGTTSALLFENNLVRDEGNFMQVGNLGTGGCRRSNIMFRRNTFVNNGTLFDGAADLHWRLCGGSGNVFERNVVNDEFWNEHGFAASGTTARDNLSGSQYAIDADGACTVAACNPAGQEPIGYRKPSGVHW